MKILIFHFGNFTDKITGEKLILIENKFPSANLG